MPAASVSANQKREMPVRTRPLSGMAVGRTTSKALIRSLATSSSRSSSIAKRSRTLPERTNPGTSSASGMGVVLQLLQAVDQCLDVGQQSGFVEAVGNLVRLERGSNVGVGFHELAQLAPFVGRPERVPLDDGIGVLARQPAFLDEHRQQTARSEQTQAAFDV